MKKKLQTSNSAFWIGGKHPVEAAINNPKRKIIRFVLSEKQRNTTFNNDRKIQVEYENDYFFKNIFNNEIPHQGFAALIEKIETNNLKFYLETKKLSNIVALDNVHDPRNIGSIIRTLVAFGFDALLINKKDFNSKSFLLYKAASGAIENILILEVSNILNEIKILKSNDFWVVGMDGEANNSLYNYNLVSKNLIVFGSEGFGMKNLIKKNCDIICKIPINKKVNSLNVSNAVASTLAILDYKR